MEKKKWCDAQPPLTTSMIQLIVFRGDYGIHHHESCSVIDLVYNNIPSNIWRKLLRELPHDTRGCSRTLSPAKVFSQLPSTIKHIWHNFQKLPDETKTFHEVSPQNLLRKTCWTYTKKCNLRTFCSEQRIHWKIRNFEFCHRLSSWRHCKARSVHWLCKPKKASTM